MTYCPAARQGNFKFLLIVSGCASQAWEWKSEIHMGIDILFLGWLSDTGMLLSSRSTIFILGNNIFGQREVWTFQKQFCKYVPGVDWDCVGDDAQ